MNKSYLAEGLGTFVLASAVSMAVAAGPNEPVFLLAGLVVALFVYTIGPVSGCHINPAVTLGALSIGKISRRDAGYYIVAQVVGAALSIVLFQSGFPSVTASLDLGAAIAEAAGTFLLTFGIASVIYGKTPSSASGGVIGGSLMLGALTAITLGSAAALNPAVALAVGSLDLTYLIGPLVGGYAGMQVYRRLV